MNTSTIYLKCSNGFTVGRGPYTFATFAVWVLLSLSVTVFGQGSAFTSTDTRTAEKTSVGSVQRLGGGKIRSWVRTANGKLTAIGVTFDEDALKDLPPEPPAGAEGFEYVLAVPAEAGETVFKHILINWNPHGHGPAKIYDVGHFDFHFYLIPNDARERITAVGDDEMRSNKPLPAELMPNGYILAPDSAVARMGSHLADPNSHEFHGKDFTSTFLFGAYDGKVIFLEPMITRDYLLKKPSVAEEIKLPAAFSGSGRYPKRWVLAFDEKTREYTVALEWIGETITKRDSHARH